MVRGYVDGEGRGLLALVSACSSGGPSCGACPGKLLRSSRASCARGVSVSLPHPHPQGDQPLCLKFLQDRPLEPGLAECQ